MHHTPESLATLLTSLTIPFTKYQHGAHYTAEDALRDVTQWPPGAHVKNLFVKDKAGNFTLITVLHHRKLDLVKLGKHLHSKDRWSFANEDQLFTHLGVKPGSVSPFCLANAAPGTLTFVLDDPILEHPLVYAHPLINTQTFSVQPTDLLRFITHTGHTAKRINLSEFEKQA
jgi:Ala-tRNA(Pro) deacylase